MGWFRERTETKDEKTSAFKKKNPFQDFVVGEGEFVSIQNGVNLVPVDPFEGDKDTIEGEEDGSARDRSDISE